MAWQYKLLPFTNFATVEEFEETLNGFGADGWEVISVTQSGNKAQVIMKRPNESVPGAPVNVEPPTLNKTTAAVEDDVGCDPGQWEGGTVQMAFQWRRDGVEITDQATSFTYRVKSADSGRALTCACTATNDVGSTTAISNACTVAQVITEGSGAAGGAGR